MFYKFLKASSLFTSGSVAAFCFKKRAHPALISKSPPLAPEQCLSISVVKFCASVQISATVCGCSLSAPFWGNNFVAGNYRCFLPSFISSYQFLPFNSGSGAFRLSNTASWHHHSALSSPDSWWVCAVNTSVTGLEIVSLLHQLSAAQTPCGSRARAHWLLGEEPEDKTEAGRKNRLQGLTRADEAMRRTTWMVIWASLETVTYQRLRKSNDVQEELVSDSPGECWSREGLHW